MEIFLFLFLPFVLIALGISRIASYWVTTTNKRKRKLLLWGIFFAAFILVGGGWALFVSLHPI